MEQRPITRPTAGPTRRTLLATSVAAAGSLLIPAGLAEPLPRPRPDRPSHLLDARTLPAGGFIWEPDIAPDGPVAVVVSLPEQLVHVYRNGVEIGVSTCSTGKPGHTTPTGIFVVLQKDKHHHSSTYNDAPMPNMQRLTWSGIALHAGHLPGYPASHGCVRLPMEFSEKLFGITHLGVPVLIVNEASAPEIVVHPGLVLPPEAEADAAKAIAEAALKSHHDTDATTDTADVVSIVISGADKRLQVLKDGVEVLASPIAIKDPDTPLGTHMYKMLDANPDDGTFTWLAHPIAVEGRDAASPHDVLARISVEDWAPVVDMLGEVRPGSVLLVTDLPADSDSRSGPDFVILDGLA
ncbi:L,D-transpeptidase [Acuticoccus mangrovi]|uniref:L,D-transpeptidase n=1 Tax=Acuticoccus mangrovi TaxID=2796142 RepID=A0A934MBS1_9HYPH|nr:L,D-transpeptidase [Acuticoccus mangrovi]